MLGAGQSTSPSRGCQVWNIDYGHFGVLGPGFFQFFIFMFGDGHIFFYSHVDVDVFVAFAFLFGRDDMRQLCRLMNAWGV